jgi:hypothetical protein
MEATHPALYIPAREERVVRSPRRPRFEQDTPVGWIVVMPVVMAATIALVYWTHALSLAVH